MRTARVSTPWSVREKEMSTPPTATRSPPATSCQAKVALELEVGTLAQTARCVDGHTRACRGSVVTGDEIAAELGPEEPAAQLLEPFDVARGHEAVTTLATARARPPDEPRLVQQGAHLERGLVGRRDEHDLAAHDVADRAREERVVRATQEQG